MAERHITRKRLAKEHIPVEGNRITIHAASYTPENPDARHLVVIIPGWSMLGNARTLKNIGDSFASERNAETLTLSATFRKPSPESLQQQAVAASQYLRRTGAEEVTLIGYSKGVPETLTLALFLEKQRVHDHQLPKVDSVISLSPLGFTSYGYRHLAVSLAKAGFFHIPINTLKGILANKKEWRKFFEASGAAMTIFGTMGKRIVQKGPVGYVRYVKQELANMANPVKEVRNLQAPLVVIVGKHDTVVAPQRIMEAVPKVLPNASVIPMNTFGHHGMPFQRYNEVAKKSISTLQILRRNQRTEKE